MGKILRLSLAACLAVLFCGTMSAQTFDFAEIYGSTTIQDISDQPATIDAVTISFAQGNSTNPPAFNRVGEVRLYGGTSTALDGCTMTVTAASGNITSIALTAGSDCTWGTLTANVGNIAEDNDHNITWTGSAQEVVFTASRNASAASTATQNRYAQAVVTVEGGVSKSPAGLAFSESELSVELGSEFTSPTFTKATNATVTFTSDNEAVASVNSEGEITLGGETGVAVITAQSEENDEYYAGTATCTITVYEAYTYQKATSITSGTAYLLVYEGDGVLEIAEPVSSNYTYDYLYVEDYQPEADGTVKVPSDAGCTFTITEAEGGYTIMQEDGRYLYQTGTYNSFNVSTEPSDGYIWTIEANADGTFTITNASVNKYVQYATDYGSFGSYPNENGALPCLYERYTTSSGISNVTVTTDEPDENAPVYNLAGQRVSKDTKGILIQNGKKFINR